MDILALIWCSGALLFMLYHLIGYYRFKKRALRWSSPIKSEYAKSIITNMMAEMNIKPSLAVLTSETIPNPMLIGFVKPLLLLPHENYTDEELTFILKHELVHYKRHDIVYKLMLLIVKAIHWFNPLVWLMVREAGREIEISCDDTVVREQSLTFRKKYCEAMLSAMQHTSNRHSALTTHFSGDKREMKQRFTNILNTKKKRKGIIPLCTVLLLIGTIAILTACTSIVQGSNGEKNVHDASNSHVLDSEDNASDAENIHLVNDTKDDISGILTKETATLGDIHLGDSKQTINSMFPIADKVEINPVTGERSWNYSKLGATIFFYQESPDVPGGGVVRMVIEGNSDMKTNTGLGIGDSLQDIMDVYQDINGDMEKEGVRTVWVNGKDKNPESSNQYFPTLKFELHSNIIRSIELSNRNVNPGPYHQKPLTLVDMKVGDIQFGDSSEELIKKIGEPSEKKIIHANGGPEWIYIKQGISFFLDPVWGIRAISPSSGSTPRGIKVGSTEDEVRKAYPDVFVSDNSLIQNSTDNAYQLYFGMENGVVEVIAMQELLELSKR